MEKTDEKQETIYNMYGAWKKREEKGENGVFDYDLRVGRDTSYFVVRKDGEIVQKEEFSTSNMHWLDRFLHDFGGKHFIEYADADHIVFGELTTPGNFDGKYAHRLKMDRVS